MLESVEIKKALHNKHNILNNQLDIKNSPIIDIHIYFIYLFILSHYLVQITFYIQLIDIIIIFS